MTENMIEMQYEVLEEIIFDAIDNNKPSSFIRFNDGEGKVYGNINYYSSSKVVELLRRHYGNRLLNRVGFNSLREKLGEAVQNATVVGVPPSDWPSEFSNARAIYFDIMAGKECKISHVDFHQSMYCSDFFHKLFSMGREVCAITCRDVVGYVESQYGAKFSEVFIVPEQSDGSFREDIRPHYPNHCEWLCGVIEKIAMNRIYLVGAGICGKLYCEAIRRGGGIAIDVGSIFDIWAGRLSRPYMDTLFIKKYYLDKLSRLDVDETILKAAAEIFLSDGDVASALRVLEYGQQEYKTSAEFVLRKADLLLKYNLDNPKNGHWYSYLKYVNSNDLLAFHEILKRNGRREQSIRVLIDTFALDPLSPQLLEGLCGALLELPSIFDRKLRNKIVDASEYVCAHGERYHPLLFQYARVQGSAGDMKRAVSLCGMAIEEFGLDIQYFKHQISWLDALDLKNDAVHYRNYLNNFDNES